MYSPFVKAASGAIRFFETAESVVSTLGAASSYTLARKIKGQDSKHNQGETPCETTKNKIAENPGKSIKNDDHYLDKWREQERRDLDNDSLDKRHEQDRRDHHEASLPYDEPAHRPY